MSKELPDELLVFDTETSGVRVDEDRILTCYAARYNQAGEVIDEFEWTVNPGIAVPEAASNVHGMTTEWIIENGDPDWKKCIKEMHTTIMAAVQDSVPIVAFNLPFDFTLLHHESIRAGYAPGLSQAVKEGIFYDPLVHEKHRNPYVKGKGMRKLGNTCKRYGIEFNEEDAHAAEYDVRKTAELTFRFLRKERLSVGELSKIMPEWQVKQAESFEAYCKKVNRLNDNGEAIITSKGWPLYTEIGN